MEPRGGKKGSKTLTPLQAARLDRLAEAIRELPQDRAGELMDSLETVFTVREAARLLSCNPETLRRAIRAGKLRAGRVGRDYRISRLDLQEYWTKQGGGELFHS